MQGKTHLPPKQPYKVQYEYLHFRYCTWNLWKKSEVFPNTTCAKPCRVSHTKNNQAARQVELNDPHSQAIQNWRFFLAKKLQALFLGGKIPGVLNLSPALWVKRKTKNSSLNSTTFSSLFPWINQIKSGESAKFSQEAASQRLPNAFATSCSCDTWPRFFPHTLLVGCFDGCTHHIADIARWKDGFGSCENHHFRIPKPMLLAIFRCRRFCGGVNEKWWEISLLEVHVGKLTWFT